MSVELIVGEVYYFETQGDYFGEKSDVAEYTKNGFFCCCWGGVNVKPCLREGIVKNIRFATPGEVKAFRNKWKAEV